MSTLRDLVSTEGIGSTCLRIFHGIGDAVGKASSRVSGRFCKAATSRTAKKVGAVATVTVVAAGVTAYIKRDQIYRWLLSNPESLLKAPPLQAKLHGAAIVLFSKGREKDGTFRNEPFLPHIPVGDLEVVTAGVKDIIRGFRPAAECDDFDIKWDAYMETHGDELMTALKKYAEGKPNFLTDLASEHLYTRDKRGLLEASMWYGAGLNEYRFQKGVAQLSQAAHLIRACLANHQKLVTNTYPPYTMYGIPLTMETYPKMFSVERIPGAHTSDDTLDTIVQHDLQKHIIIFSNGIPFALTVIDESNEYLSIGEIYYQLDQIQQLSRSTNSEEKAKFSVLSGQARDVWSGDRKAIIEERSANKKMLNLLGGALFHLSLDDEAPSSLEEQCSFSQGRVTNTWFDACVTWTVGSETPSADEDGRGGTGVSCFSGSIANHEHADAGVYADLQSKINTEFARLTDSGRNPLPTPKSIAPATTVSGTTTNPHLDHPLIEEVRLHLPESIADKIPEVTVELERNAANRDLKVLEFTEFGTRALRPIRERGQKFSNVRADPFCEIAIHVADALTSAALDVPDSLRNLGTYESATTAMFKNGRTDTINAKSKEMTAFVKAFLDSTVTKEKKLELFLAACNKHKQITYDAMSGKGVDRMVMALHAMAKELKIDTSIFEHPALKAPHRLTTSQVLCVSDGGGYGPEIDDGYGIFFKPGGKRIVFHIQSKVASKYTNSGLFRTNLQKSLNDLLALIS